MPGIYRRNPGFARRGRSFRGAIWMIGLAVLFFSGRWWPGILILIGISLVFSAFERESEPRSFPDPRFEPQPIAPPAPVILTPPSPAPAPFISTPRADLLPDTCPRCGAPVRGNEIKWNGTHSASCSYCGSTLPLVKS